MSRSSQKVTPVKKQVIDDEPQKQVETKINTDSSVSSMDFSQVADCLAQIEVIKGKNSQDKVKSLFKDLFLTIWEKHPNDLVLLFYFLICKIGADYKSKELGIGNENLIKCIAKAVGRSEKNIKDENKTIGDLSVIASENKGKKASLASFVTGKKQKTLTISYVLNTLRQISEIKGKSSSSEKESTLLNLLNAASSNEIKFIIRFIQGKMNIGASYKIVASAFARAVAERTSSKEEEVDILLVKALDQNSDYDYIFEQINAIVENEEPIQNLLHRCPITPGVPLKPMLAKATTGVNEILQRFSDKPFTCEYKYDGYRGHLHYSDKTGVQLFSRNLEDATETYPDVVVFFLEYAKENKLSSFIIDGEILPFDTVNGKILPFQVLTTRKKKNVEESEITVRVKMFLFDIIYLEGKELINEPLKRRREILKEHFKENDFTAYANTMESDDPSEILEFMNSSIVDKCEGLIIKGIGNDSVYIPGSRDVSWLKLKKDYITDTKLGDSLDLVPIGATWGSG